MSKPERREILSRVAAGTISPEEAAAQLDALHEPELGDSPIRTVRVQNQFGSVEVIGDASVREAVAEGAHQARVDGQLMVIEPATSDEPDGFFFGLGRNIFGHQRLVVRMNPSLNLELDVQAGTCRVRGIDGQIRADVQAGSATIDGFKRPFDLSVQAGSVTASGRLDSGESRIRCDAGSVKLHLEHGTSARIRAHSSMGKIRLPDRAGLVAAQGAQETTIGAGEALLAIDTSMGNVLVTADE